MLVRVRTATDLLMLLLPSSALHASVTLCVLKEGVTCRSILGCQTSGYL